MVALTFNPSIREADTGGSLSLKPACFTEWILGQPGLHKETGSLGYCLVVAYAFNPSPWEADTGRSLSSGIARATQRNLGLQKTKQNPFGDRCGLRGVYLWQQIGRFQEMQTSIYKTDKHVAGKRHARIWQADISAGRTEASKEAKRAAKDNQVFPQKAKLLCLCVGGPDKCSQEGLAVRVSRWGELIFPARETQFIHGNGKLQRRIYVNRISKSYFSKSL